MTLTGPTEILPGLFIGDATVARDEAFFHANNIRLVVNCTPDVPFYFDNVEKIRIDVDDTTEKIDQIIMATALPVVVSRILNFRPSHLRGVLIHCYAGVSRSCTVAAAVLRTCCSTNIYQAISMVIAVRPWAFFGGRDVNFLDALTRVYGS